MGFLLAILAPFRKALAWAAAAVAIIGGAWLAGRRDKAKEQKIDRLEQKAEAHDTRNEVENRIASERDARKRLRDDWSE